MNEQELERRFLGSFIHARALNEQVQWLNAQPEIENALNALANRDNWMTTRFVGALGAVCAERAQSTEEARTRGGNVEALTLAAILKEAPLPQGIGAKVSP